MTMPSHAAEAQRRPTWAERITGGSHRWITRSIPGYLWVQFSVIWNPRHWQRPRWHHQRYGPSVGVYDYACGPLWLATMKEAEYG